MAAIENRIVIGNDSNNPIFDFDNDTIMSITSDTSVSLVGEELYIDQFEAQVDYYVWIPYVFKPTDYDGFMSSDSQLLCSRQNYDIRLLPYGTKITYYMAGVIAGVFYVKNVERVAKEFYKISAVSAIGLMDKQPHKGGIYTGQYLQDVIEDIVGTDFDYIIDGTVAVQTVYGWLPYATRRENLYQLMLAYGFEILVGDNGAMFFTFPDDDQTYSIPASRVYSGGKVIYDEPASRVEVIEHSYHYDPAVLDIVLFDNSSDAAVTDVLIKFDQPIYPQSIYCSSGSLTISETYANYAIVSGVGVLKGKPYAHNERLNVQENENSTVEKVVSVQNATAVSFVNADNVLARLSEFYFNAQRIEQGVLVESEKPGQLYVTQNAFGEVATGFLTKMQKTISAVAKANCRFIQNYTPVGAGAAYTNRVLIPLGSGASQTWTIPSYVFEKETPSIRVTLIGKGANGEDGQDGETPTDSPDKAVKGGAGGQGGQGGAGGNIFTVSFLATGMTEVTLANSGNDSVLTSLYYNYSSADGAPSRFGYFDILTQEVFAHPGEAGVPGGNGGDGDYYTHSRAAEATMTDGESVTHNGVTYNGGAFSGRNVISGSRVFVNSQYSGNLTLYTAGAGGGGAAVGSDGGDAFAANDRPPQDWWEWGKGGDGADGADADETPDIPGMGGGGGHGGGGGGAGATWESWNHVYSSVIGTGNKGSGVGGAGGKGGIGRYGCAIIYY